MVLVAISMVAILGFAALAIDGGFVHHGHAQLQHAADATALAAIGELRNGETIGTAISNATAIAQSHKVGGDALQFAAGTDLEYGTYDLASQTFSPGTGGLGVAAFKASTRRSSGSASGPLQLFLGNVIGVGTADVETSAVAAIRRRDVLIVQDATWSFYQEFPQAIDADLDLVNSMAGAMALPGDRVGVMRFSRQAFEHIGLTDLSTNASDVIHELTTMPVCSSGSAANGCNGTGTADAINLARQIFARDSTGEDAEKVMILLTDGVPCHGELPAGQRVEPIPKQLAVDAADAAEAEGINIFAITLAILGSNTSECFVPQPAFTNSLARGFGIGVDTPNPDDLDDILVSILRQMPVRMVQ